MERAGLERAMARRVLGWGGGHGCHGRAPCPVSGLPAAEGSVVEAAARGGGRRGGGLLAAECSVMADLGWWKERRCLTRRARRRGEGITLQND
jgi:hypothetical protein